MNNTIAAQDARQTETGMLLMGCAMLIVPGIDAVAKLLSASVAPAQVAWGRFLFQAVILATIMLVSRRRLATRRPAVHAVRGALVATAVMLIFWALAYLPLANTIAIFFVEPLFLTLLSALFLREAIGRRRVAALVVGFAGALIVIRPSWSAFGWPALLPLVSAALYAAYLAMTRHAVGREHPFTVQLWADIFATITLSAAMAAGYGVHLSALAPRWPDTLTWLEFAAMGAVAISGHMLMSLAFHRAPANILAPFRYLEIISATLLGWLLFGHFPDAVTWAGTAMIVGAGVDVFLSQRRSGRRAPSSEEAQPPIQ
jgi:drug/metabolite transporter (DMT)-like permease